MLEATVRPQNSLVLVMDALQGEIPESMGGKRVSVTGSCVAVGTLMEQDGPTRIRMLDSTRAESEPLPPLVVAETTLQVPSKRLTIQSVLGEAYLEHPVDDAIVNVKVYVNDSWEPDDVAIVIQ